MSTSLRRIAGACALFALAATEPLLAQRQLSWDSLDVSARLAADGVLHVTELQTMVFTGDWNGGERAFDLRPRQRFDVDGMERIDARERVPLTEDSSLDDVDEYAFTDTRTLRWRSRLPSDAPFAATRITYAIHYRLSGILLREDDRYVLDHDFAFPDRDGEIRRFALRLTVDEGWQPLSELREVYTAGPIPPGRSFVLTVPLRFSGAGSPEALDTRRPREVVAAVSAILGALVLSILWLLLREQRLGRFATVSADRVDAAWIRQNILAHPAEVVGAAWDQDVDKDEVAAIISRMVSEGKLTSHVKSGAGTLAMNLQVPRESLGGYERTLVDGLFFEGRSSTSTDEVKAHYENKGYDPAKAISSELNARVTELMPKGDNPPVWGWPSAILFLAGGGCLVKEWLTNGDTGPTPFIVGIGALILAGIGQIPGVVFRQRIDWGMKALLASLVMPVLTAAGVAAVLWYRVGTGAWEWSVWIIAAATALTLWIVWAAVNGLKSRNHRDAIAFRKMLAAGRMYFQRELEKERPALSDDWYPWIAAFGLTNEASQWAVQHPTDTSSSTWRSTTFGSSSSGTSSSEASWTGAAGGRSGGAGGGATWAAAVGGMAAGVAAPSSSSSSGGSSGSSGGSSSGGSSGGGGGGGW